MSRKDKKKKGEAKNVQPEPIQTPRIIYAKMQVSGPVPIAPPSRNIQLTPIVQPIAMVPYSSQQQPVYAMEEVDDDYDF